MRSGVNTEECQFSNEGICHDLECKCGEGFFIRRMSYNLIAVHVGSLDGGDIGRCGHIFNNCIQKLLNTLVAVCGTAAVPE